MLRTLTGKPVYILTTRFNSATFEENRQWRERNNYVGCVYCSPIRMPNAIPPNAIILMIEMNNDINKIVGIGMFINKRKSERDYIYTIHNYNRYVYKGKIRVDREFIVQFNSQLISSVENLVFKGKDHIKRGIGFTSIPNKKLTLELYKQFQELINTLTRRSMS